jgi:acetate kinase
MNNVIIVLNAGSTSLKCKIFDYKSLTVLVERGYDIEEKGEARAALQKELFEDIVGQAQALGNVALIAHRVVHGGPDFFKPAIITKKNIASLEAHNHLAPLHNPHNISFIRLALNLLPNVPNVAVFDTGFYAGLPDVAKVMPIPYKYFDEGVQRYGFHGISHEYAASEAAKLLGKPLAQTNLIILHLGGGSSVSAIRKGKPVDVSLGFTPLGGAVMSTRSGDMDPGVIIYLMKKYGLDIEKLEQTLNHQSGIMGICGAKNFLELLNGIRKGDRKCRLAFDMFVYRLKKYVGAFYAVLGSVDAIVFTGSIGSGKATTRQAVLKGMPFLADTPVFAIKTNEELSIARQAKKAAAGK